jgi:pyridoxal phosphate enzyme (YggS family)
MQHPTARTAAEIHRNLTAVRDRIARAAARSERAPEDVRLLVVTKTVPADRVRLAAAAGCRDLGENKVQEAKQKSVELSDLDVSWSIIGHLQTNKAKTVASFAQEFQALDSLRVADALDHHLQAVGRPLDVFVQVNTSGEESKYGVAPDGLPALLRDLAHHHSLRVRGLMTLATFTSDTATVRSCFRLLRTLRDQARDQDPDLIGPGELSMGMSGDYEIAIEEGATCVRVGQAIFGERPLPDSHYWPDAEATESTGRESA